MGCPRDRVNAEWEREGREKLGDCAPKWRTGKRGDGKEKHGIKFEPITVCFCTVMNQGNQNQLQRGVLANKNGNADQLTDHSKPSNPFFTLSYDDQWARSLQTQYKHTQTPFAHARACVFVHRDSRIDPFLPSPDTITLMLSMEGQTFQTCHMSGLLANH